MSLIVLASASPVRAALLRAAGVAFTVEAPPIGVEEVAKARLEADGATAGEMALGLAEAKASSLGAPGALVIGADQTLEVGGASLHKAANLAEARRKLKALRGRSHRLHSAAALARDGVVVWRRASSARLTMRPFTDAFLDDYLDRHGERLLTSVGCYRVEDDGIQLFAELDGDYFTVLGLPLLPLLEALRAQRALKP